MRIANAIESCLIFQILFFSFSISSDANWLRPEQEIKSSAFTKNTESISGNTNIKCDSLPAGVSKDWLNSLLDENGNPVISEDPEGDAIHQSTFNGTTSGEKFGYSVSSAGDVNGDGLDDIIIGAPYGAANFGKAYIYYGGLNFNTTADVILTGDEAYSSFGKVSSAGDVNGDGYSDVIVGASDYGSLIGKAYIYYGGTSMNTTADVIISGEAASNYFGYSVSEAGDVNNDGYSDVIVGAYGYNSYTGKAYIYFGGTSMNNVADVIMTGEATYNHFGSSISGAGDVNGDGYSDVIVGAERYNSFTGRAYLYYGSSVMNNVADVNITGVAGSSAFGSSVSGAGDVNNDGYSDVIIGASNYSSDTGRAYILYGGALMNNVTDFVMTGEAPNNYFGTSVSGAGDVNRDGYSDVVIGASGYNSATGRAYLYYGGAVMNNAAVILTGKANFSSFALSVSDAGDFNGDGYSDLIIGAAYYSSDTGRAYIFYGGALMNNVTDFVMTGEAPNNYFGTSVSGAGDVNGDGYSDVFIGAPGFSSATGRAYLYYGGAVMNNAAVILTGKAEFSSFAVSVSDAGDFNGDGYSDLITGAQFGGTGSSGTAYVYTNTVTGVDIPDITAIGESAFNFLGYSVSSAGDVNDDGYSDVIVGAYKYSETTGRAYIYYGGSLMNNVADVTMTFGNLFGFSVSGAGDVNGDGFDDVIVGSHLYNSYTGRAMIFYGAAEMDNVPDVTMYGEFINSYFGYSVSGAGDLNNDGYSDVIVGAYGGETGVSRAYIFNGGVVMDNVADVTMSAGNYFGFSVSGAGDVNDDGFSDVIVSSHLYNSYTGRASIYFGSVAMDNVPDVTIFGESVNSNFGSSVSEAGDVNGDGYSDVIVGAFGYNANTGRAYLFYGGAVMNTAADVIMTGTGANNGLGVSVSGAGDVNGDGYSDVIVGAHEYSTFTGRAYIYFGGAAMNNVADVIMTGETSVDQFGYSVSGEGDVNGDGYSDVTAGGFGYSSYSGRAYIFLSSSSVPHGLLNLTMLMEGFYDNVNDRMRLSDTTKVYLRNSTSPYAIADSSKGVISKFNFTGKFIFNKALPGLYYITVKHRNIIETWSSNTISFSYSTSMNYNLTSTSSQAYGNNEIQVDASPVRFAVYSGDVNQDGTIDLSDASLIDNDAFNFLSGYLPADVNGDEIVDVSDAVFADNNGFNFVGKVTP